MRKGNVCTYASPDDSYTKIRNNIFRDGRNISPAAGWIYCQLLSLPKDWEMSVAGLVALNSCGKTVVSRALTELEELGYLIRIQARDEQGRLDGRLYVLLENPDDWEAALAYFGIDKRDVLSKRGAKALVGTKVRFSGNGKPASGKTATINYYPYREGKGEGDAGAHANARASEPEEPEDDGGSPSEPDKDIPAAAEVPTPAPACPVPPGSTSEPDSGRPSPNEPREARGPMPLPSSVPDGFAAVWAAYPKKPAVPASGVPFAQSELGMALAAYEGLIEAGWAPERIELALELYKAAILQRNGAVSWTELGVKFLKTLKNALTEANLAPFAPVDTWEDDRARRADEAGAARYGGLKALRDSVAAHLDSLDSQLAAATVCTFWTERGMAGMDGAAATARRLLESYEACGRLTSCEGWDRLSHFTKTNKEADSAFCLWYAERFMGAQGKAA